MRNLTYIAMPYSHTDKAVVAKRMERFYQLVSSLMMKGEFVISPVLNHPICELYDVPSDYKFWKDYSRSLLERCDNLIVLMMPGWEDSIGVKDEIEFAKTIGLPIQYMCASVQYACESID